MKNKLLILKKVKNPDYNNLNDEHPENNPQDINNTVASSKYMKYLEYKAFFDEINNKITDLKCRVDLQDSDAMSEMSISGASYFKRRDDAEKRWKVMGYKEEVEKIMSANHDK